MMTKLREFSKIFIYIVAISFILLMVFEWGMDYSGRSSRNDKVGEVNGVELSYGQFSELYQQLYQNERARAGKTQFDENELQQLRETVWEQFIQRTLFGEEMEKLGISVSDSEVVYQIYHYPMEDFKQHPSFQTDGVFDINKYHAAFSNPNIPWGQVEEIYRQQIPYIKLQNIITSTIRISDEEALDEFEKQNMKVKVEYLGVQANRFNLPNLKITEDETKAFYEEHKEDYKQNEMRELAYVLFPIETDANDTLHVLEEFKRIRDRLENGEKFNDLAKEYSEDPSVKTNNGDLGYFERGAMVKPFSDAAFSAQIGDLTGPVETSFGMHLIHVEDKKVEDGKEKVKASHILLKVTPAPSRIENIEGKARFFAEDAKEAGFAELTESDDEYKVLKTGLFEEGGGYIPDIGRNPAIMYFAFSSELNTVSNMYRTDKGYAIFCLTNIQKSGYKDLESVKLFVENRVKLAKAKEEARQYAQNLSEKVKSGKPFKTIAENDDPKKVNNNVTSLFTMNSSLPGVGKSIEFNASAFSLEEGQISDLIETDHGFYYQKLLEKTAFDSAAFAFQKDIIQRRMLSQKRNQIFNDWYNGLKEKADIIDNRKMFNL